MTPRRSASAVPALRRRALLVGWLLGAVVLLGRSIQLQVFETARWREAAASQHRAAEEIVAARGAILDRDGMALAVSRETFRVGIDPSALVDAAATAELLQEVLGISPRTARRVTAPSAQWHVVPGRFEPSVREALADVRGVYLEREVERFYPRGELARGILGAVVEGEGRGGIEQTFDGRLRGRPGRQVLARNAEGRPIPGAVQEIQAPIPGEDVRLTIDLDLQEIAHQALTAAVEGTGARGGDLIVSDPRTGEVLALVSMEDGSTGSLSAINTPYEPGSTLKPFTVAALLEHGLADLSEVLDAEGGRWIAPDGRPLNDVVPHDSITLAEALRVSSNVAVAKAALRLSTAQQFEVLRDFGFGVETGISLPGEVSGTLRRPEDWTERSPVALAIGYEASVTPLQMTMAYGALANGGLLLEPRLVLEGPGAAETGGRTEPAARVLRQVVSPAVTRELGRVLVGVVEEGSGTAARLGAFRVAGKSGTSRVYVAGSGYTPGRHFASFAGYFPADDPQLVIFVKLDSPTGSYYGGSTAAPVTRATMEAVLAARKGPLDRRALVEAARPRSVSPPPPPGPPVRFAALSLDPGSAASGGIGAGAAALPPTRSSEGRSSEGRSSEGRSSEGRSSGGGVIVPDVRGLPARSAVRRLHTAGLRVRWDGSGAAAEVVPGPGTLLTRGDTVLLRARPGAVGPAPGPWGRAAASVAASPSRPRPGGAGTARPDPPPDRGAPPPAAGRPEGTDR